MGSQPDPFNARNQFSGEWTPGLRPLSLADEIRRDYRDSTCVVSDFMLENAEQDDLVYVSGFADREAPDWILVYWPMRADYWNKIKESYSIAAALDAFPQPTQRPEINFHAFEPIPYETGIRVLRRMASP